MSRVVAFCAIAITVAGCSMSQPSAITSLNDLGASTPRTTPARQAALGGDPTESRSARSRNAGRLASLNDRAPSGSYDKAPRGSLSDRDYSQTRLDSEMARDAINAYRKSKGLKPLTLNATLTAAAKSHSRDLAKWDRISHFGSDGSNPWDRVKRAGYNARLAAENVGTGQVSFSEVLKGWEQSPGHNKNLLLRDATHMGIALVHEQKTEFKTFWTLVIGAPL
ncbi:MAG: CAP domain-containing protein [Hyphomicrobiaceae bacterium]